MCYKIYVEATTHKIVVVCTFYEPILSSNRSMCMIHRCLHNYIIWQVTYNSWYIIGNINANKVDTHAESNAYKHLGVAWE